MYQIEETDNMNTKRSKLDIRNVSDQEEEKKRTSTLTFKHHTKKKKKTKNKYTDL